MEKFKPQVRTKLTVVRHINYTCDPERYAQLEKIALEGNISLKELLRQMVEFSLRNM
jgi:hypothetical protein